MIGMKVLIACEESQEEHVEEIQGGDRGDGGFGSTGR